MSTHFMTRPFLPGLLAALAFCASPCSAEEPAFRFNKQDYFLRSSEGGIREYLTAGETFEKWSTLISVRSFEGLDDPRAYAMKLVALAKASGPNGNGQVLENEGAGFYIADFLVYSKEEPIFAEWNLWRIEKKGDGLQALQYARRFYKITDSTADELIAARKRIVPLLAEFAVPK